MKTALATIYYEMGDHKKALEINEKVYELRCKVLGEEHPNTLTSLEILAGIYDDLGNYEMALRHAKKLYTTRRRVFGDEYPDTLTSLNNLALTFRNIQLLDIRNALDLFFDEDIKARNVLTNIIQMHLPAPVENASARDYLHAYALGLNKNMLIEGVTRYLYEGTQFSGMVFDAQKELVKYEDDWLEDFYLRVKRAHGCDYTDSEEKMLKAKEDMISTVDLYNTLTAYRILKDIKQDLVHAYYYAKEYPDVLSLMNLFD